MQFTTGSGAFVLPYDTLSCVRVTGLPRHGKMIDGHLINQNAGLRLKEMNTSIVFCCPHIDTIHEKFLLYHLPLRISYQ